MKEDKIILYAFGAVLHIAFVIIGLYVKVGSF